MIGWKNPRLWTPLAAGVLGSAISLSVGLGQGKWAAIVIGEVATAMAVLILYFLGAQDTDVGAVFGHRADERQQLVRLKAARLSTVVAVLAMVIACVIAAAIDAAYWPFELLYIVTGAAYIAGLRVYGAHRDGAGSKHEEQRVTS